MQQQISSPYTVNYIQCCHRVVLVHSKCIPCVVESGSFSGLDIADTEPIAGLDLVHMYS